MYTRGLGRPTASQHNMFDSEKLFFFNCAPDGIRTSVLRMLSPTLYELSHPVTPDTYFAFRRPSTQVSPWPVPGKWTRGTQT